MSATLVTPKTASGGEIIRELINSSDGQGLHFSNSGNISLTNAASAEFGTSDFSIEFILNQTGDNASDNYLYLSHTSGNSRFYLYNDISADDLKLVFINSSGSPTTYAISHNMANDYNEPTHYVLSCDRSGNATLYTNSNSVGTVAISGSSSVNIGDSNTVAGSIGDTTSGYTFLGSLYRFRTYNKALTQSEVDSAYQKADVDFADQYGSETSKLLNGTAWTGASGTTAPNSWTTGNQGTYTIDSSSGSGSEPALKIARSIDNPYIHQNFTAVIGAKYRISYKVKNIDATQANIGIGSSAIGSQYYLLGYSSTDWQTVNLEITATTNLISVYLQAITSTGTQAVYFDSVEIKQIGAVTDYDLAFANPTQSLMVQDRAGVADGTATSGVSQTQKIPQLNATAIAVSAATARTVSDGHIVADRLGAGIVPSYAVDVFTSGNNGIRTNNGTAQLYMGSTAGVAAVGTLNDNALNLISNGGVRMTISSAGLVTATSANQTTLSVVSSNAGFGGQSINASDGTNGKPIMSWQRGGAEKAYDYVGTDNKRYFNVNSADRMSIDTAGLVTINNDLVINDATGLASIKLQGGATGADNFQIMQGVTGVSNSGLSIYDVDATATRMSIDAAGRVSIGGSADPYSLSADTTNTLTIQATGTNKAGALDIAANGTGWVGINLGNETIRRGFIGSLNGSDMAFYTNPTNAGTAVSERLRITSAGNVAIGLPSSTPISSGLSRYLQLSAGNGSGTACGIEMQGNRTGANEISNRISFYNNTSQIAKIETKYQGSTSQGSMHFETSGAERLSISAAGLATFAGGIAQGGISGDNTAYIDTGGVVNISRASGVGRNMVTFTNGGSVVGSITSNTSATQYNTSSDYRLKENLTPLTNALDRIEQLPVYRFNFKADSETTVDGFVAHEAQAIVPESVTGEKDAMKTVVVQEAVEAVEYQPAIEAVEYQPAIYYEEGDELPEGVEVGDIKTEEIQAVEGQPEIEAVEAKEEVTEEQPDMQGIDQSKLVPVLWAAVRELKSKVEALENA